MLVSDDTDEVDVLERRYRASTADRSTFALTIVTSLGCNFDCPYCFENKPPAVLDAETERLLLEVLDAQLPTIERFHVTWYGGEPLLAQDRLDRCRRPSSAYGGARRALRRRDRHQRLPADARRGAAAARAEGRGTQVTLDGPRRRTT